jgi:hypothetical protein
MSEKEWIELGKMLDQAREHREDGLSSSAVPLYKDILKSDLLDAEEKSNVLAELGYAYYDLEEYKFASKSFASKIPMLPRCVSVCSVVKKYLSSLEL